MPAIDSVKTREFAIDVVRSLRDADFEALWAGGCVRDQLMGREPKDYDVATNATPDQIRSVFGHRRTLAIGASFGVITVLGDHTAGQIDVATFRKDSLYSDGRHPDSVTFCEAEEDARRRDFTINGLFYDPLGDRVFDYVDGQADLNNGIIRAIGEPTARLNEDKLRMLRAVRFATTLGFDIESKTWDAVCHLASSIHVVSHERITEELRRILTHPARSRGVEILHSAQLLYEILPEAADVFPKHEPSPEPAALAWDRTLRILQHLDQPPFAVAVAVLLREIFFESSNDPNRILAIARRWRLANDDTDRLVACLTHEPLIRAAHGTPWPQLQRMLIHPERDSLLTYGEAVALIVDGNSDAVKFCRDRLQLPVEQLNPPPLLDGHDLQKLGLSPGPIYRQLLNEVRDRQLNGELITKQQAVDWVQKRGSQPT